MNWQDKINDVYRRWNDDKAYFEVKTSGSTGSPKTIRLEKKRMHASATMSVEYFGLKKRDKVLLALPADKVGGIMLIIRSIVGGLDLITIEPKLNPILKIDLEDKIDFCSLTPAQLAAIFNEEDSKSQLKKIKTILLGGSSISSDLESKIQGMSNYFYHSYGMTETISHIAIRNLTKKNDYFEALSGVRFENNKEQQLTIHAPAILSGPLLTNDLVELYGDKKMLWRGRKDNVVNSGGIKIIVEEVEAIIRRQFQGEFYLLGEEDAILGEKLVMVSKLQPPSLDFLEKLQRPKEVYIRPTFRYTANGKLLRLSPQQLPGL